MYHISQSQRCNAERKLKTVSAKSSKCAVRWLPHLFQRRSGGSAENLQKQIRVGEHGQMGEVNLDGLSHYAPAMLVVYYSVYRMVVGH